MYSRIIPFIFAFMLMGLHFYRQRVSELVVVSLLIPLLLFIKKRWILNFLQVLAYLGALEWMRTIFYYIQIRSQHGMPWLRLAAILSVVALFTAFTGYLLNSPKVKERYPAK